MKNAVALASVMGILSAWMMSVRFLTAFRESFVCVSFLFGSIIIPKDVYRPWYRILFWKTTKKLTPILLRCVSISTKTIFNVFQLFLTSKQSTMLTYIFTEDLINPFC